MEDNIEAFIHDIPAEMLARACLKLEYACGPFEAQCNILQILNYIERTIDSNKDFMQFSEFHVCLFEKRTYLLGYYNLLQVLASANLRRHTSRAVAA